MELRGIGRAALLMAAAIGGVGRGALAVGSAGSVARKKINRLPLAFIILI